MQPLKEKILSHLLILSIPFFLGALTVLGATPELTIGIKDDGAAPQFPQPPRHVVLLGASIGRAWNISSLPSRIHNQEYTFEYVHGGSSFNKSDRLREILSRSENKPDAIFLKECAAYFPGDMESYKSLMRQWIKECQELGVIPIPTTVVPVTRLHSLKKFLIDIIKLRNPFSFGGPFNSKRNRAILEYNDWIKGYCKQQALPILDLEAAVRRSGTERYLRGDLATIDGLHLNKKAYRILDRIVIPTLNPINWNRSG
jgi:hypothetical protein